MTDAKAVTALSLPEDDRSSERFLQQLARALASAEPHAGVVIDRFVRSPRCRLVVRPSGLLRAIEAPLMQRVAPSPSAHRLGIEPPHGWAERFGVLMLLDTPTPSRAARSPDRPGGLANPLGPRGTWVDTRTYWVPRSEGGLWAARLYRVALADPARSTSEMEMVGTVLAQHWSSVLGRPSRAHALSVWGARRAWREFDSALVPRASWSPIELDQATSTARLPRPAPSVGGLNREPGHLAVFGTSGAGKTSFLAELACEAIRHDEVVVAIDLHGDLAPGIVGRLDASERRRLLAVDVTARPIPGINILGGVSPTHSDRSVAHLVAAFKRLSPDGEGIYWGFRLERIFDAFIRLVQEEGGSLVDLAAALQNEGRREALRASTRSPELARFLEELAPVLKRQPDFLWPAASRVSKVVLVPALRELLAPEEGGLRWEECLREGRSLLIRIPFAEVGSEAAALASTLLLTRIYLDRAASASTLRAPRPLLLLLDEGHAFSPRLVAEILGEGRKFGVRAVLSTQYPERLSAEVEHAVRGCVATHLCFRVPVASAGPAARWLGVERSISADQLAALPTGTAVVSGQRVETLTVPFPPNVDDATGWSGTLERTRVESGLPQSGGDSLEQAEGPDADTESLLLAVYAAEESAAVSTETDIVQAAAGAGRDAATLATRFSQLVHRRWVVPCARGWKLGSAGAEALGIGRRTGAVRESAEHRALLLEAFRIFARRGYRLEILRQGRFDTTLPDARLSVFEPRRERTSPNEWARQLDRARLGWAWRFFSGRNVHVEAEVSGALRAERIRHGCHKGAREGVFTLFLVGDAARARRVRGVLHELGLGRDRAQVWTLGGARRARPRAGEVT